MQKEPAANATGSFRIKQRMLLDFDFGASLGELLLDLLGVFLGNAFLDRLGSAVDHVLGVLEAETP